MRLTMYAIPNCSTVKKARDWLKAENIDYSFHNYKKEGIDESSLHSWCKNSGWKVLLNQRGTTWRKLSSDDKADINEAKAVQLMAIYPSLIKRPVLLDLDHPTAMLVGFNEEEYRSFFAPADQS